MDKVNRQTEANETQLVGLLRFHYGDGQVYMPRTGTRSVLLAARRLGLVDVEGFLTRKGRVFLAVHDNC